MLENLASALRNWLMWLGILLALVVGGVLAGTVLIDYVLPFAIWLLLRGMNKAPRGVAGSLGLPVAAVSFSSR